MGIVFRALDTTLDREVAVKVLSADQSADDETLRRFRNEAQSAARLNHDNIAHVFYVGQDRGVHYIVFEFIEGVNIRDLVEQHGPLPLEEAVSYTYQIAQALEHASQRAVIHRDIKPSNVLITPDGKAKLVDMGLARLNQLARSDDLTASGVTLGTFDYISPEQARDPRSADVRSDLYSLGCSFFFMLTGRPPFPDGTVLQKLLQHQGDSPPDPREFRPELPAEVTNILAGLLA
jgi:serine/threonine-protein kinase